MQTETGMLSGSVGQHAWVGGNQGIHTQIGGLVHGSLPACPAVGQCIGVDRDIQLPTLRADHLEPGLEMLV